MNLPDKGFLRINQIIGQDEVTKEQAEENKRCGKRPVRPRREIPALIPVKKSTWWAGVKSGKYPQPTKAFGPRVTVWRVEDIITLLDKASSGSV